MQRELASKATFALDKACECKMMDMAAGDTLAEGRSETPYNRAEYLGRLYDENFVSLRRLAFALVGEAGVAEEIAQEACGSMPRGGVSIGWSTRRASCDGSS